MRQIFYYAHNKKNSPVVTVCLLEDKGEISRGVAVCSPRERAVKSFGRQFAFNRAQEAMATKATTMLVRSPVALSVVFEVIRRQKSLYFFAYKSEYNPKLNPYEVKLLRQKRGQNNEP